MKRTLKVGGIVILIFILIIIIVPFTLKGKINTILQKEVNKQLNASVAWDKLSVSLIKHFPQLSVDVGGFSICGADTFKTDTLLMVKNFGISVDLMSVIKGNAIEINAITIDNAVVNAIALNDSVVNWDILKASETETDVSPKEEETAPSDMNLVLDEFLIRNANIFYKDYQTETYASINDLTTSISADISSQASNLVVHSLVNEVFLKQEGVRYLKDAQVRFDATLNADFDKQSYTFVDNTLAINDLKMAFDGMVQLLDSGYLMDLSLRSQDNDIKSILSLLPDAYKNDVKGIETRGSMSLDANVKGVYLDENHLPAFDLNLQVNDGYVKYASLPGQVEDINVQLNIQNPGGLADSTKVDLSKFHFKVEDNPFDATLMLSTPVSNANFAGMIQGIVDLQSLENAIPGNDEVTYKGSINADIQFSGDQNKIDNEQYDLLHINGNVDVANINYQSSDLASAVIIPSAQISITSQNIVLKDFHCKMGQSDFELNGYLKNYMGYAFSNKVLYGKLNHHSKYINVNQLLANSASEEDTTMVNEEEAAAELVEIPKNLDLVFTTSVDQLLYDKLSVANTKGTLVVRSGAVNLNQLVMNLLDGKMILSGQYDTKDITKPFVDFDFNVADINIKKTAKSFSVVDSLMPVAKNADGNLSAQMKYYSLLNADMSANISTIKGKGNIRSKSVTISNSKVLNQMADLLKKDKYRTLKAEDININFVMNDGKIIVEPFTTKVYGSSIKVSGEQGFDQSLNYVIEVPVSRQDVSNAMGFLGAMVNPKGDDIMVDVLIKGYANDPKMNLDLKKAQKQLQKEVSKETKEAVDELMKDENVKKAVDDIKKKLGGFFK